MDGQTIGAVVGVAFGCGWGIAGATGLQPPWRARIETLSVAISAALIAALAIFGARGPLGTFRGDVYGVAVTGEAVGIVAAVWLLRRCGLSQFLLPAIGFIVGLHFIGLWRATELSIFVWVAVAMCIVCALAVFVPTSADTDLRRVVAGIGSAAVLFASGLAALF
jgi:hypothetical protein